MSDVARYLPLSQQDREDESAVTGNWSGQLGAVLVALAGIVDTLGAEEFDVPGQRPGFRVWDSLGHILWRLGTPRRARLIAVGRQMVAQRGGPRLAVRTLSVGSAGGTAGETASSTADKLRALAAATALPGYKATIADLSVAVVDGLDVARSVRRPLQVDAVTSGAVALARSLSAPTPIRAVVSQRTLKPTDAHWSVGHGESLDGTAADIVLFLSGRAGIPRGDHAATANGNQSRD